VLILPDGTRSYIPAAWTDFESPGTPPGHGQPSLVALLPDLLRIRQRVDVLLRRIGSTPSDTTASTQENPHASKSNGTMVRGTAPDSAPVSSTQPRAAEPPHRIEAKTKWTRIIRLMIEVVIVQEFDSITTAPMTGIQRIIFVLSNSDDQNPVEKLCGSFK